MMKIDFLTFYQLQWLKTVSDVPDAFLSSEAQKEYEFLDTTLIVMNGIMQGQQVKSCLTQVPLITSLVLG